MKKLFFSFVMMIALVIVAGSAMAQSSITPYLGGTYSYSVADLDPAGTGGREVEIYITTALNANMTIATDYVVTGGTTITGVAGATTVYKGTLPASSTAFSFNVEYKSTGALAAGTLYRLWIKVYDGTVGACSNVKFINVTPAINNFELSITAMADVCQSTTLPTTENIMGSNAQYTEFTYDISAVGVGVGQNWRYTLTLDKTSMAYLTTTNNVEFVSASTTSGTGAVIVTTAYSAGVVTLTAPASATTVRVTFRILTTPGAQETFVATMTNEKLMNSSSTVELYTDVATGDNADVMLKRVPFIGGFTGDN